MGGGASQPISHFFINITHALHCNFKILQKKMSLNKVVGWFQNKGCGLFRLKYRKFNYLHMLRMDVVVVYIADVFLQISRISGFAMHGVKGSFLIAIPETR